MCKSYKYYVEFSTITTIRKLLIVTTTRSKRYVRDFCCNKYLIPARNKISVKSYAGANVQQTYYI